jgi:putative hydrolase of the HAD superfamily
VTSLDACLVDAYDTILTCDFSVQRGAISALAGVAPEAWQAEYDRIEPWLTDGRITKTQAFGDVMRACGREPRAALVAAMVARDRELLLANARLYDDSIGFLEALRARGVKIAIVSNCTETTRPLLVHLGIDILADTLVLSCEVGAAKPDAPIFVRALDQLGTTAQAAVFVDDQARYCAGAVAVGITTTQIVRGEPGRGAPAAGTTVVRSLPEVQALFTA